ncbi:MAG: Coq4 family protein [Cyanobacteria bacterium P01_C01_bin.118]
MNVRYLLKAIQSGVAGKAGDTAAYKAAALSTPAYGTLDQTLASLTNPLPEITLDLLQAQPDGSLGKTLAQFLQSNQIQPLTLSSNTRTELKTAPILAIRYPILHDAFHVLLGFDTSLAGELAVWSFVAAQHYSPAYEHAALIGRWFTRLITPWQWGRLSAYETKGRQLGQQAICVIAEPLEEFWAMPLDAVRVRFNLPSEISN